MLPFELPVESRPITEEEELALGFPAKRGMLDLDVYTVDDLAERLDLHTATIKNHIKRGNLQTVKFGGATGYRILRQDVYQWLISLQTELRSTGHPAARGRKATP